MLLPLRCTAIAAIVEPVGARSMSRMRACSVLDRAAGFDEAG
jgi:hypothetical protein